MTLSTVFDWSGTAASNTDVGGISLAESVMRIPALNNAMREQMAEVANGIVGRGTDIASASTISFTGASTRSLIHDITGTTTITAVTLTSGHWRVCRAAGAFQITASASLIVNGSTSTNWTCATGDLLFFEGYGSSVVRVTALRGVNLTFSSGLVNTAGTITVDFASTANYRANTADKVLDTDGVWGSAAEVTLTDAATIAVDMSTFINAKVTLGGNRTLGQPSNTKVGQAGCIRIIQDGTGSRTLAYHADWKFAGGNDPVLTTTASATDLLFYQVVAANVIYASLVKAIA